MATDATGAPTPLGIPKFNTSADAPSGLGSNAQMDSIDTLIAARIAKPSAPVTGDALVWNGTTWEKSSGATKIAIAGLAGYPSDGTKVLKGDGTWGTSSASGPAVNVTRTTDFTIPASSTWSAAIGFDSERFDTGAMHDNVTNNSRLTAVSAGKYLAGFNVVRAATASTGVGVRILKNGTTVVLDHRAVGWDGASSPDLGLVGSVLLDLALNDYLELQVMHTVGSTGTLAFVGGGAGQGFWAVKLF